MFTGIGAGGAVRNLGLRNVDVTGAAGKHAGALAGSINGAVSYVYVSGGTVDAATSGNGGGLTGLLSGGSVTSSWTSVTVTGVTGYLGGLAGSLAGTATIENSYAIGDVEATGIGPAGGLASSLAGTATVTNSYAIGDVKGTNSGGLITDKGTNATVTTSYWDTDVSGQSASGGGTGKTSGELQSPTIGTTGSIYLTWSADKWDFVDDDNYPMLKVDFNGDGTATWQEFGQTRLIDYDDDNDGLIEIVSIDQLYAIQYDINSDDTNFDYTFPDAKDEFGCDDDEANWSDRLCTGFELMADLDFDSDGDGDVDITDHNGDWWNIGKGWAPIGEFTQTFDGNGHTISNLFINVAGSSIGAGLFEETSTDAVVRNLGLVGVNITMDVDAGAIVGVNGGAIQTSYATGAVTVTGNRNAGGLVGTNDGSITGSYSLVDVTSTNVTNNAEEAGGIAGHNSGSITASYAAGSVTGGKAGAGGLVGIADVGSTIVNSYATGAVSRSSGTGDLGGLVGKIATGAAATASYWDTATTGQAASVLGTSQTTSALQTPTSKTGIYAAWDADKWDFGTNSEYPQLKADWDGNGTATAAEFGDQDSVQERDHDSDDDGFIEVNNLAQLNAIRWDLDGNGTASTGNEAAYAAAFPHPDSGMGCSTSNPVGCVGYELMANLDFDTNSDDSITSADEYWNGSAGWAPIGGSSSAPFAAKFEGNGKSISNLHISRQTADIGLFGYIAGDDAGVVRKLALIDVSIATGGVNAGALAGVNFGSVNNVYSTGSVRSTHASGNAGGLVGKSHGVINESYSTASVRSTTGNAGGLAGTLVNTASITRS